MKLSSLSVYLSLASAVWIVMLSALWAVAPGLRPTWYDLRASIFFGFLSLSYFVLTLALWVGLNIASPAVAVLLLAGGVGWAVLSSSTLSVIDVASILLLLVSAVAVVAAWRWKRKSSFHPLDYPVYG